MATVSDSIAKIVQEVFVPKVDYYREELFPIMKFISQTARRVSMDDIGRDWKVIWPFRTGLAGATSWSAMAGPDIATSTSYSGSNTPPGFQQYDQLETWPGISESTVPAFVQRSVTLKKMKVNLQVPLQVIRAAQLGASIGDQVEYTIEGTAERVAREMGNVFLAQTGNSLQGVLGSIDTTGQTLSSSGTAFDLLADGASTGATGTSIRRFTPGLSVDLYPDNSNTRINSVPVFVDIVDPFEKANGTDAVTVQGSIRLYTTGSGTVVLPTDCVHIVPRNSGRENASSNLPTALDSMLINTGSVYGVNVANYPILKSMVRTSLSGVLSESVLLKHVARYHHARGGLFALDSVVASEGVWAGFFRDMLQVPVAGTNTSVVRYDRNGKILTVRAGVAEEVSFSLYGRNYRCHAEPGLQAEFAYVLRLNDNFQIVRPPRIPGTKTNPAFDAGLEFIAPLYTGTSTIFLPYNQVGGANAGAISNMLQAPAEMPYEIIPECLAGIKLGKFTEFYG